VDIVPAGVTHPGHCRAVRHFLLVLEGQGIDVGPQQDRRAVADTQVDLEAGVGGQGADGDPGHVQPGGYGRGGLALLPGQLRVGVEPAPEGDQLLAVGVQEDVEGIRDGDRHRVSAMSSTSWATTARRSPPDSTSRRWRR